LYVLRIVKETQEVIVDSIKFENENILGTMK